MSNITRLPCIRGVALIAVNPLHEVLVGKELQPKPHLGKYPGTCSPPMETLHRGESQIDALKRLIQEELDGLPGIEIESIPHGEYWIASARATLYVGHTRSSRLPALGKGMSDVGGHRWIRPEDALGLWLRRGAWEMLSDYIWGRTGVVCHYCRPVSATPPDTVESL